MPTKAEYVERITKLIEDSSDPDYLIEFVEEEVSKRLDVRDFASIETIWSFYNTSKEFEVRVADAKKTVTLLSLSKAAIKEIYQKIKLNG